MRKVLLVLLCTISIALFAGNGKVDKAKEAQAKAWVKNQQLEFVENKGQFKNTEGKPADNVLFKTSYGGCDIYITNKGLSYVFIKFEDKEEKSDELKDNKEDKDKESEIGEENEEDENKSISYYRLDMDLVGATISKANIIKEEESKQGHYNYFYPHCPDGIYNVKGYGKITIKNIYKGIDWVIYTNPTNKEHPLKYDFIVHPEGNYKDIKIKYLNAQSTSLIDNDTKLKIQTIAGTIEEGSIYSYQNNNKEQEIYSRYTINTNDSTIAFEVGAYDNTQTLIIDPLVWATYYGGSSHDGFRSICSDSQNNIFITGYTYSSDFPTQVLTGAFSQTNFAGGGTDIIILKFNAQGVRQWATYYGGISAETSYSIGINSLNEIYITGYTASSNFPTQQLAGAYWQSAYGGNGDIFILKFNNAGIRQWATFYGGNNSDQGNSLCIDHNDNVYIIGYTSSTNFPLQTLTGAYWQASSVGSVDVFILKFNNLGVRQWATYYGGNNIDYGYSICSDTLNNIYVIGSTQSSNFPTLQLTGAYFQSNIVGSSDAFILKFNNLGVLQWATYYGGNSYESFVSICSDKQNNVFVIGNSGSTNFPTQQLIGSYWQASNAGNSDFVILKFNNQCVRQWATYYGGSANESFMGNAFNLISIDTIGNIYISGQTTSTNLPIQQLFGEYWQSTIIGNQDLVLLKFSNLGVRQYATYYGGTGSDFGTGVTVDKSNNAYFVGEWTNIGAYTINPGSGAYYDSTWNGADDSYILKIANHCFNYKTTSLQSNRNNICINESGTITLTAIGGAGDTLKWYKGGCGQTYVGKNNPLVIPIPTQTTTYYARWESNCDFSACDSIKINIVAAIRDTLNPVICQGQTFQVGTHTYTAADTYIDSLATISGCDSIIVTHLTIVPLPNLNLGNDTILCNGQSLHLNAATPNTTYLWQDGSTNATFDVTQQGTYWVKVSINSICFIKDTIHVSFNSAFSINLGNDTILCTGETMTLNAAHANSTYLWQDGATTTPTFYVYYPGTFYVKVTNSNNCTAYDTINVTIATPSVNLGPDTTLCYWQTYYLYANNPGAAYLWQNGSTNSAIAVNQSGTYSVKITYNAGCTASDTVKVEFGPYAKFTTDTNLCSGQTLTLNAYTPGAAYIWQDGSSSPTYFVNSQGTYYVKTIVNSFCNRTDTIHVHYTQPPIVNLGNDTLLCYWQSLVLSAVNPYCHYLWNDGTTFSNHAVNQQGTYWVMAYVNSSCWARDTINVTYKPSPMVNLGNDTVLCTGQSLNLNASFPFCTYLWQNGSTNQNFTITQQGTYWVKVSINAGCFYGDTLHVNYVAVPNINLGNDTTLCQGQSLLLNAINSNAVYHWQNGSVSPTYNVTQAGTYWVKVTVNSSCFDSDTINVSYYNLVNLGNDTTLCYGQTLLLSASYPNATYQWQNGSTNSSFTVSPPYTPYVFWVKVTTNNCSMSDTIDVNYYPAPLVNFGNDTILCNGQTLELDVTNPNSTYTWQDGSFNPLYTVSQQGVYWVYVLNDNNCTATDTIHVTYYANPSVNLGNDTMLCTGQTLTLNAAFPNANYIWHDNSTNAVYQVSQAGTYWVNVSINNYCFANDTIHIVYNPNPIVNLGIKTDLCPGESLVLNATILNGIYLWQDGSTANTYTATIDGTYSVKVTDTATHCIATASITLECELEPIIPNIITPNGDGFNDYFVIVNSDYWNIEIQIYNRWGVKVYEDNNYKNKWDGKYNGNPLSEGVYFYVIKAKNLKGTRKKEYHGSVTILR